MKIYEYKLVCNCVREDAPTVYLSKSDAVKDYMKGAFDAYPEQEQVWIVYLNRKNVAKGRQMLTLGTQGACLLDPPLILRSALLANATAFVLVHNHPSGDPSPSGPDLNFTRQLREAAKAVWIEFLDHVIVGTVDGDPTGRGYYSFREAGLF